MSDIFRIDTSDNIKLTGGAQNEGICTHIDTRDVRTRTELESGAQNAGGNDSTPDGGGISSVYVSGCLTGSGTAALPISIVLNPTGGIACGDDGLFITNVVVVTGVSATSITTSGCLSGSGTPADPTYVRINPTGGIQCTLGGLALQHTYLTSVTTSGTPLAGNGTTASPLTVLINPTGKIQATALGLSLQETYLTHAVTSGCVAGSGTAVSPISLSLNPTGGLHCTPGGLAVQFPGTTGVNVTSCLSGVGTSASPLTIVFNPTGKIHCTAAGIALQEVYLTQAVTSGCVGGIGTAGSPIVLNINPTGGLHCTPGGLAINATIASTVVSSGCVTGSGTVASPLVLTVSPTGGLRCASDGLALETLVSTVVPTGCLTGSGTVASPLALLFNPTGKIHCTAAGIALQEVYLTQVITSGCITGIGTAGSPVILSINPTGGLHCTPGGLAINMPLSNTGVVCYAYSYETGIAPSSPSTPTTPASNPASGNIQVEVYDNVMRFWMFNGTGYTLDKEFSGGSGSFGSTDVSAYMLQLLDDPDAATARVTLGISGNGTPASPLNSIQFNNSGLFGGSSNFTWDNTSGILNVTGTITTRNVTTVVHTIVDGPTVDLNPSSGSIQVWTLGGTRTPTANFFNNGQAITLMIDDGAGNSIDWSNLNPTWIDGAAPSLPTSGYGLVELWKVGSTIYGASLSSGVASAGGGTPGGSNTQIQFNNAGSFGGEAGLTWNGTGVTISGASLTASRPGLTVAQTWNSGTVAFTGVLVNINDTNSSSTSKLLDLQVGGNTRFNVNRYGDAVLTGQLSCPYFVTTSVYIRSDSTPTVSMGASDDIVLTRDAADRLALRRGTNSQALYVYNNYISTGVYERAGIDWAGSPGVLQIGTQHAGSGVPRGLQLITSGTPRIDIQAGGAIQFYGAYTFPSTNGSSGQVLTTNGAGTLTWGNVSGAASSADYFIDETDEGNSGTSITINFGSKANHKLTLTGHCTLSFTAPASARETKIRFVQGGTGGYSITLPSGTLGTTPVLPTGVGSQSVVTLFYDRDGNWHV